MPSCLTSLPAVRVHRRFLPSHLLYLMVTSLWLMTGLAAHAGSTAHQRMSPPSIDSGKRQTSNYDRVPLAFEPNQGQSDPAVKFISRGSGYSMFLTRDEVVLDLERQASGPQLSGSKSAVPPSAVPSIDTIRMKLLGASASADVSGADPLPGVVNYFIGDDPKKWHAGISTFGKVNYSQVYPGIDLVFYGNQRQLEYDFVVAPGADASRIAWRIDGAKAAVDKEGSLMLDADHGPARFKTPVLYQMDGGRKVPVEGSFQIADGRIGFGIGTYDHSKPLVIDPVLSYASYLGGSALDSIGGAVGNDGGTNNFTQGLAIDSNGSAYVTGTTYSTDFPTQNPYQATNTATTDNNRNFTTFVTKFSPDGSSLVYSTYLGGSGAEFGNAIAVDSNGNAYVTGQTYSNDFPITPGAYDTFCGGGPASNPNTEISHCAPAGYSAAYVTKLNATGTALVYSTFLGGEGTLFGLGIAVDSAGRAYVEGISQVSCNDGTPSDPPGPYPYSCFQTTSGAVIAGSVPNGGDAPQYAFISVLDPNGANLVYSSLFGSTNGSSGYGGSAWPTGVSVDANGNFYLSGWTLSPNLPTTTGTLQTTAGPVIAGNPPTTMPQTRGFVAKFNPVTANGGATLAYATYLGGSTQGTGDRIGAIVGDSSGNAYVTGFTNSQDFPVTSGSYEPACQLNGGGQVCSANFVVKLNPTGTTLLWGTYLGDPTGSPGVTSASGPIALDGNGNIYVTGEANGVFPQVNPIESYPDNDSEHFIAELDPTGANLLFSTYIDASYVQPAGLAVDAAGNIYAAGNINNGGFLTTPGAFQPAFAGSSQAGAYGDGYVLKIAPQGTASVALAASPSPAQGGQSVTLTATVTTTAAYGSVPTGTVVFQDGSNALNTATLNASGVATYTTTTLGPATHTLTAVYSGDSTYATVNGTTTLTVTGLTPTVTVTPASSSIATGSSLSVMVALTGTGTTPTGTVTLAAGSFTSTAQTLANGSATIVIPANSLAAGANAITVSYSGDSNYSAATGMASVTGTVPLLTPTVTVTPASTTLDTASTLSVAAAVTGSGATPTGTVTLSGAGYTSTAQTLSSGTYTFSIPANSLSAGTDTLTVSYSGDGNYAAGTGTSSVTVTASAYTLAATSPAAIAPGATATSTVTVSTTTAYAGSVTLACTLTSSPSGAADLPTCSAASTPVALSSTTSSGTATVTVTTTASSSAKLSPDASGRWDRWWEGAGGGAVLACVMFFGIPARRRNWQSMLGILLLMTALGSMAGCGSGSHSTSGGSGTTAGTYTFTVSGTGTPSVTPAPTTTFTLTIN